MSFKITEIDLDEKNHINSDFLKELRDKIKNEILSYQYIVNDDNVDDIFSEIDEKIDVILDNSKIYLNNIEFDSIFFTNDFCIRDIDSEYRSIKLSNKSKNVYFNDDDDDRKICISFNIGFTEVDINEDYYYEYVIVVYYFLYNGMTIFIRSEDH